MAHDLAAGGTDRDRLRTSPGRMAVIVGFAALGVFWGSWGAMIPAVQRRAHVSDGQLGTALLLIGLGAALSMRGAGAALDRFEHRATVATIGLLALTTLPLAVVRSPGSLMAALFLVGCASGAMDVAINGAGVHEELLSGPLLSTAHASFSAAVVVFSLLAGVLLGYGASIRTVLGLVALFVGAAAFVVDRLGRLGRDGRLGREGGRGESRRATEAPAVRRGLGLPPLLLVLGALCAMAYLVENAWQNWGAVHLSGTFQQGPAIAALAPGSFAAAAALGRLSCQRLVVLGHDRVRLIAAGAVVAAVGTTVAALAPSAPVALAAIVVAGAGTSVIAPLIISLTGQHSSAGHRSGAVSLVTSVGYLGFVLGPAFVGLVASALTLRTALALVGAISVLLAASALVARPRLIRTS